ncbi:MAG: 30S ribosomal protein S2 [Phycisphaerales bacterium]|nr:30S ribosomal protein S2 [Phycisphaerales bacterium]MCK6476083.1 30S ribosomal protein S2 [Phycisphaerales bacterium]
MANTLVQDLIEAGIHFGQRSSGWNPKMAPYIYGKRNGIHIIDIKETIKGLLLAKKFIAKTVSDGKDICFVGTKRQAKSVLETRVPDVKMHWVTERWLGGTLTNFRTIRSRLKRMIELEGIEANDNFASYSKKMESQLRREMKKIKRNLDGIRNMEKLPGALVVIDVRHEATALQEARKLGIPTICLIDTDGDPEAADIPIPGNDDSMRSIDVVVRELCLACAEGRQMRQGTDQATTGAAEGAAQGAAGEGQQRPRRSRRPSQYSASAGGPTEGGSGDGEETRDQPRPAPSPASA